jgi:hypothetical protein
MSTATTTVNAANPNAGAQHLLGSLGNYITALSKAFAMARIVSGDFVSRTQVKQIRAIADSL